MLEIINYNNEEYGFPSLLVLGCFDALHKGHAALLKKAKLQAKINGLDLGVMLFAEGKGGKQVFTYEERLEFLKEYNVKFVLKIDYNEEFKKTTAAEFLHIIDEKINIKGLMSGKDFRFGAGAKGKSVTLKSYADDEENGVWYESVKDVTYGDEKISTTLIKSMLENGDIGLADELLGRNYFICGKVVNGSERGGKLLNYPTINVTYPENKVEVKTGVYTVLCTVDGNTYKGIANYGARPTFNEETTVLEAYLDGFEGDLYGKDVKIEFCEYIRDIQKFDSAEALKEQLDKDILKIRENND